MLYNDKFKISFPFLIKISLVLISILIAGWSILYFQHFKEIISYSPNEQHNTFTVQDSVSDFEHYIYPILKQKCADCHTNTTDRPFFYYIPGIDIVSKPYTENKINEARNQFDFSEGLPVDRLSASMEMVLRLQETMSEDSMPPLDYRLARPHKILNHREKEIITTWVEKSSLAMLDSMIGKIEDTNEEIIDISNNFADELAKKIVAVCPLVDPGDKIAKENCADGLVKIAAFRDRMNNPFLWGGQKAPGNYKTSHTHVTRFNPLLWRKFYLSLFMFEGSYIIETDNDQLVYRFPVKFRYGLDDGDYPYPFWHSESKWKKYVEAAEIILLIKKGRIIASFRSAEKRKDIPEYENKLWSGDWLWREPDDKVLQPRVTNYNVLFSPSNPYIESLDKSFWKLSLGFRSENCVTCHSPENSDNMKVLELLTSPGHALAARNRLVKVFEKNAMPPISGIRSEETRNTLVELAREFKALGDKALEYEGEGIEDFLARPTF